MDPTSPILASISGGRSSALAIRVLTVDGIPPNMQIVFANTGKERDETLDFLHDIETNWGLPIVWIEAVFNKYNLNSESMRSSIGFNVVNYETAKRRGDKESPFEKMIEWVNCHIVPNRASRFCTTYLKIVPMDRYMKSKGFDDYETVLGIRYDEPERWQKHQTAIMPLVKEKITHPMVRAWWHKQPFDLKLQDFEGNCDLCHLKGLNKVMTILEKHPSFADWWIEQERKTNSLFRQNVSMEDILRKVKSGKFRRVVDTSSVANRAPELFNSNDYDISCFCGD